MHIRPMSILFLATAAALLPAATPAVGKPRPLTVDDFARMKNVSEPALSPDGKLVAYTLETTDFDEDRRTSDVWLVPSVSGPGRRLTFDAAADRTPRWSPDGLTLGFLSMRSGDSQVWILPMGPGEAWQLTDAPGGVEDFVFTPDGRAVVFAARTYADCADFACTKQRDEEKEKRKVTALVHERLLYRHWDSYDDGKVQHLFVQPVADGAPRDLTRGLRRDALVFWLLSAQRQFTVSPDSRYVYFAGNQDEDAARSFDSNLWRVPIGAGGGADGGAGGEPERLTDNPAADDGPRVSPDGRRLAWRATRRAGYEADRFELMVMDLGGAGAKRDGKPGAGTPRSLTQTFDRSVGELFWSPDGERLYFTAEDSGDINLYAVDADGGAPPWPVVGPAGAGRGYHVDFQVDPDGESFVYRYRGLRHTWEIYRATAGGRGATALTHANDAVFEETYVPDGEDVWFAGADGTPVQGFLLKPIDFRPGRKQAYPLLVRIHGGPQQMFGYAFRAEYPLFTGAGYFVFYCNPRGSTGYGQAFTDAIRGDWGGKVYDDLRAGVRHVLEKNPAIDPARVGAWGGSFGAYLVNWIQGHDEGRMFAALVAHAGSADRWTAWGTTEELWFPEWEMLGPPWDNPELNDRLSPIRYAQKFATPQLLTHGERDYRVGIAGSETMFTALQTRRVPSKFIRFPDEGHWIRKPQNQRFWYAEVLAWMDRWLKPAKHAPEP